jgi:hypothetical protein
MWRVVEEGQAGFNGLRFRAASTISKKLAAETA